MAAASGVAAVVSAVIARLRAHAALTALVPAARIVSDAAALARPYIVVGCVTETPHDTLGRAGIDAVVSLVLVSDYAGQAEIGAMASAVRASLDGAVLAVSGFEEAADVLYEQAVSEYMEDVANVAVRYRPLWFRVVV